VSRTLVAIAAIGLASVFLAPANARDEARFVLDRTYACSIPLHGGVYRFEGRAHPGVRAGGSWSKLAYASLRTGPHATGTRSLLAWVSAGVPTKTTTVDKEFWAFDVRTLGTVGVRGALCNPTTAPVPFTAAGLRGGPAAPLGDELRCDVPRRVLVRLRAVLPSRAILRGRELRSIHVPVREAKLAAHTLSGTPLSYATVSESGKATLFTAKGCVAE
jgi:hypothetical protein